MLYGWPMGRYCRLTRNGFKLAATTFTPHAMKISPDGGSLYVSSTNSGTLSRIDGIQAAVWDTAMLSGATISDSLSIRNINSNLPSGRSVTDIEVDYNNPNRVIVTLGNYGNSSHVYITENALDDAPTWRSIQGALPNFPVYDAEISVSNPAHIILGTEFGVYYAQNGNATTPTWDVQQRQYANCSSFPNASSRRKDMEEREKNWCCFGRRNTRTRDMEIVKHAYKREEHKKR